MEKLYSWAVVLCSLLALSQAQTGPQTETNEPNVISPPEEIPVTELPVTFTCFVFSGGEPTSIIWYIDGELHDDSQNTELYGVFAVPQGDFRENLVIDSFNPLDINSLPAEVEVACGAASTPGLFFANFTVIPPPVIAVNLLVSSNVTVVEGGVAELCVEAGFQMVEVIPSDIVTSVDLRILAMSTATVVDDYGPVPASLSFSNEDLRTRTRICTNISIVADDNNFEDVETLYVEISNPSSPNVGIDMFQFVFAATIACNSDITRLTGGIDENQGIVEYCISGNWVRVCADSFDELAAEVVCREVIGFDTSFSPIINSNNFVEFINGLPTLQTSNCLGNESSLFDCGITLSDIIIDCSSSSPANVDCLGRPEPVFDFVSPQVITIVEGDQNIEICVQVTSGEVTVSRTLEIMAENTEGLGPVPGLTTIPPLLPPSRSLFPSLFLVFPTGSTIECFTFSIADNSEIRDLGVDFRFDNNFYIVNILDNDLECFNGSLCINIPDSFVFCVPESEVCNGFPDCFDGSDESNCPEICPPDMYTCRAEGSCLTTGQLCDGYPDCLGRIPGIEGIFPLDEVPSKCPTDCTEGSVSVVGGRGPGDGIVRLCSGGQYVPLSLFSDHLRETGLTVVEASLICQDLGLGQAGYFVSVSNQYGELRLPLTAGYQATLTCPQDATALAQCTRGTISAALALSLPSPPVAVNCGPRYPCSDGDVRLSPDGPSPREGRVEVCYRGVWGAVYDSNWGKGDAAVVCRQLGYTPQGAIPSCSVLYNFEPVPFIAESINCVGNESSLLECASPTPIGRSFAPLVLTAADYLFQVAGVRCDDYQPTGCDHLDVRLTHRDSTGQEGQFEICNNGVWQTTCASIFSPDTAFVACAQLFGDQFTSPLFSNSPDIKSDTAEVFNVPIVCTEIGAINLSECNVPSEPPVTPPPGENRKKRIVDNVDDPSCTAAQQPTIRCSGPPVIYVSPDLPNREYELDLGIDPPLIQCLTDHRTHPGGPSSFVARPGELKRSAGRRKRGLIDVATPPLTVVRVQPLSPVQSGTYSCNAQIIDSPLQSSESLNVNINFGGDAEFGFIQFSIIELQSFLSSGIIIPGFTQRFSEVPLDGFSLISDFVSNTTGFLTPGRQSVNCFVIQSRAIDIERGLVRMECEIGHFPSPSLTGATTTAAKISTRLVELIPLLAPFTADVEVVAAPTFAFTSAMTVLREGEVVSVCLSVVSGEVTRETNVTLTTEIFEEGPFPPGVPNEGGDGFIPVVAAFFGFDYTVSSPFEEVFEPFPGVRVFLTFQPGDTESCFTLSSNDDDIVRSPISGAVEATFSYQSSSSGVGIIASESSHSVVILDNDFNCTGGQRLCQDFEILRAFCVPEPLVCNFVSVECSDESDELNCPSPIEALVGQLVDEASYTNISSQVSEFAAISANGTYLQTNAFLSDLSTTFTDIAGFVNTSNVTVNSTVVESLSMTLNSLAQWQSGNLETSMTSSIVESFEVVITVFAQQDNITVQLTEITVVAELGATELFMNSGSSEDFTMRAGVPAIIELPAQLFSLVPEDRPVIGVYFALYANSALLPASPSPMVVGNVTVRETAVGSPIVASTVGPGIEFGAVEPLDPPVVITLGILPLPDNFTRDPASARCVSWDFPSQSWITDGCVTNILDNETYTCECTHLTNFAILIDICRRVEDCVTNPDLDLALSIISYIGVALSCIGLLITIVTLLFFKKLRERDNSKYHIQLSIAIFCMLVVFAAGVGSFQVYAGCIIVSALIHYFTLAAVLWMGAEALLMFQKLVIVFMRITTKFIVILSLFCWLAPLIPVLISLIIDVAIDTSPATDLIITRNYDNVTGEILSGFCFLKHPGVFFGAFLIPILLVMLFNLVIFIWVIVILVKHTRGQLQRSKEGMKPKTALRLLISISGVMFLFGLTWLFAAFTFTIAGSQILRDTFQVLFAIFASFQGFFIFIFFCVLNKEARESWREVLSCGKYRSKMLHPSKYQNTSSAGGTRGKSKTASTGLTTGTATPYASQAEKSTYESEYTPEPEKRDLSKHEEEKVEIPMSSKNGQEHANGESVVETVVDVADEEEMTEPKWSEAEPVKNARVKRYSTKKAAKHHIEEFELDFESVESGDENEVA